MSNKERIEKYFAAEKAAHNRSTKPAKRLLAAMAAFEFQKLQKAMPGCVKRGFARGKAV